MIIMKAFIAYLISLTLLCQISEGRDKIIKGSLEDYMNTVVAIGFLDSNKVWKDYGTGFLMYDYGDAPYYLITNKHIFQFEDSVGNLGNFDSIWIKAKTKGDYKVITGSYEGDYIIYNLKLIENDTLLWTGHTNKNIDIAVIYFPPSDILNRILNYYSEFSSFPKSSYCLFDSLRLTQNLLFFGFPLGIGAEKRPAPVVRSGMLAYLNGSDRTFLMDGQAFGGSSGSPVITTGASMCGVPVSHTWLLAGIVAAFRGSPIRYKTLIQDAASKKDSIPFENSGLTIVHSTDLIIETIKEHDGRMQNRFSGQYKALKKIKMPPKK